MQQSTSEKSVASYMAVDSVRRFLLFQAMFFAFGGFLFYAGVVVPIGSDVVGSTTQGFVTQRVTSVLNVANSVAVLMLAFDIVLDRGRRTVRARRVLVVCASVIGGCTAVLFLLHGQLDALLIPADSEVVDHEKFYLLHRIYLWVSTVLWLATLPVVAVYSRRSQ